MAIVKVSTPALPGWCGGEYTTPEVNPFANPPDPTLKGAPHCAARMQQAITLADAQVFSHLNLWWPEMSQYPAFIVTDPGLATLAGEE